jgi:iron-sulfur cluster repair protein YtfE (RIC family)
MEEEALFPVFERSTGFGTEGPTAVMRAEHVEILGVLEQIAGCLACPDADPARFEELRSVLVAVLGDHNDKEEHVVYPLTDRALLPDQCRDLVRKMRAI